MTPLVSIIIPLFNREELIVHTLQSIKSQTYTNWECIVVDDGSSDKSYEVVWDIAKNDPRIKIFRRPSYLTKGANSCRNYGLSKAIGTYINWFDSDDLMMADKLMLQVAQLEESDLNYSICQTECFDSVNNKSLGLRNENIYSDDILNDYINFKIFWITGAPLWKRNFLIQNNFEFDEELQQSQEYDYHINIIAKDDKYLVINKPLMQLIKHENNMSNQLYDSSLKIYSNIKSRYSALIKYQNLLNEDTKRYLLLKQLEFYKKGILVLKWKETRKAFTLINKSYSIFCSTNMKNFKFKINWFIGTLSFKFFKKGERFFKTPKY